MGRTRNLPFLPTCGSPSKTLSFRASTATSTAISGEFDDMFAPGDDVESVIRGLRTDRFFFNPGNTSSILEESKPQEKIKDKDKENENVLPFKESVSMMEMESTDPFVDFKKSMQEMMEADEGLKQWDNLQELLCLYLAVNDKLNHCYIIGAFIDLLVSLSSPSKPSESSSCSSSTINGQKQSLLTESGVGNNNNNNNKLTMMSSSDSPESGLSFTSSFASSSGICSSTSHFLSSCSLEDDEEDDGDNHRDDEDHKSPQKASVSDHLLV